MNKPDFDKVRKPTRNLIDLREHSSGDFGFDNFVLSKLMGDIMLVEFVDLNEDGSCVKRGAIYVPTNTITHAWRKGRVILKGPDVQYAEEGDIVVFPNNLGIPIANLDVKGKGKVKYAIFLNEARMFGVCEENESTEITTE